VGTSGFAVDEDSSGGVPFSSFELRDELLEVDGEAQRSPLGVKVWVDVLGLLDPEEAALAVVGKEDYQRLVEDPEVLARPALICIGEGGSWQHSNLLSGGDVVAVGSELETGVLGERFAHDPNPLDEASCGSAGCYECQPRIAVSGSSSQMLALEKRRELFAFVLDLIAIAGFDAKRRPLKVLKQRTEFSDLHHLILDPSNSLRRRAGSCRDPDALGAVARLPFIDQPTR
jgi:hypothetical protein